MTDLKFAVRSLLRAKGLTLTVVLTLALGIGANAAIFSVVRGVLLRPLVNRDADRLIYIRQTAKGVGIENANFSVPELRDLQSRAKTLSAFGDFSTIEFTRKFNAPRRLVFEAHSKPEHIRRWWGPRGTTMWNDELDRIARFRSEYDTIVEEMETAAAAQVASLLQTPFVGIRVVSDNITNGGAYDPKTSEACEDFVYEVVKTYLGRVKASRN